MGTQSREQQTNIEGQSADLVQSARRDQRSGHSDVHENAYAEAITHADASKQTSHEPARTPSLARVLLYSGLVALGCGAIGAWSVMHFMKPDSDHKGGSEAQAHSDASPDDSQSSSKGKDASDAKLKPSSRSAEKLAGSASREPSDGMRTQIEHLSGRIDEIARRIDALSIPRDSVPPEVRQLQVKVGELAHTVSAERESFTRLRQLEKHVDDLSRQVHASKPQADSSKTASGPPSPASASK
jgi:hypothetical protein